MLSPVSAQDAINDGQIRKEFILAILQNPNFRIEKVSEFDNSSTDSICDFVDELMHCVYTNLYPKSKSK